MQLANIEEKKDYGFLRGGGEMGEMIRNFDWSQTPLGAPGIWPQSLRTSVSILLNSQFPMFVWWEKELTTIYNDSYKIIAGDKHPSLLGRSGRNAWAEIWEHLAPLVDNVFKGNSTWSDDMLLHVKRHGYTEKAYFTFSYSPVLDDAGNVRGLFCAVVETTGKVLSKKRLEESEQNLRDIILTAPVAMTIFRGPSFVVELANERMFELWGRPAKDVVGKPVFEALPEAKGFGFEGLLNHVYTKGEIRSANEQVVQLPRDGQTETVYVTAVYAPFREGDGTISGITAVAIDVTQQVIARRGIEAVVAERTKELAVANQQLQQSNKELQQFAYIASHDLQEPIRKVTTFTQMLERSLGPVDDRSKSYIDKISSSSQRMLALIRDVLTFSQLSQERASFRRVDLMEVLENIKSDFELLIEEKQATINCTPLPVVTANPLQMNQLFSNLMSNALKFVKKEVAPIINITASILPKEQFADLPELNPSVDYYNIRFSDNGVGFEQKNADKIFDIFQRLHSKKDYEGTGIGLAICKKIAINHNGNLIATSSLNNGASFDIFLPAE